MKMYLKKMITKAMINNNQKNRTAQLLRRTTNKNNNMMRKTIPVTQKIKRRGNKNRTWKTRKCCSENAFKFINKN